MSIDLSQFRDEVVSSILIRGQVEREGIDFNGRRIKFLKPIGYEGEIYRVDGEKLLYLEIFYRYKEDCGRCLEPFIRDDSTTITAKLSMKPEELVEDEDEDIIYYTDDRLNLQDHIIDTIILFLPMKPLCGDDCKGLCPKCGTNHNKEKCDCVVEDIDPRLEKLKEFFSDK
ncbi:MAG TPA: DUF177 domain-containing protein [Tepidimicrobium sp.]|nr:DUF177 domain-containing protein [Tepidimicrobium sp.]